MGKTTNALEKVVDAFYAGKKEEALLLFEQVKQQHLTTAKYLLVTHYLACEQQLKNFLPKWNGCCMINRFGIMIIITTRWFVPVNYFPQRLSVLILNETGISNKWMDVRDIFRTDDDFRDATIDWEYTFQKSRVQ